MSRKTRRQFLGDSLLTTAAISAAALSAKEAHASTQPVRKRSGEKIRIGVIGVRGRGRAHVNAFRNSPNAEVVGICDPDSAVIEMAMKASPEATYHKDIRSLLDDPSIHAVSVATPNHWHSLASIWALQAGKHVYVEKPLSHNVVEGRRLVEIAQATGKVVAHGSQARSQPATIQAIEYVRSGALGKVKVARGLCYKRRNSIGKVDGPQQPPETCDYDLWTGPADLVPLRRKNLHYDWHWDFNTGNGDIGNQGVHQMDLARWGLGKDTLPNKVTSCGARLGYVDDANTPNTQVASFDYGDSQLIFEVRGLQTPAFKTAHIGTIFHCENGYVVIASYNKCFAYDNDGKQIKVFEGSANHFQNFLDAIDKGDPSHVTCGALDGHLSSALGHIGNISYQLGGKQRLAGTDTPFAETNGDESFARFREHLAANGIDAAGTDYAMGPTLDFDAKREVFTGARAAEGNARLGRRGRGAFVIPEAVGTPQESK